MKEIDDPRHRDEGDIGRRLTEWYRDIGMEAVSRQLLGGTSHFNEIEPAIEEVDEVHADMPGEYEEFRQGGTPVFEMEDQTRDGDAHPWFDSDECKSRKGCLKIAKVVKEQDMMGEWIETTEFGDLPGISYSRRSLNKYLNSLANSPMFEAEKGNPNKYKMIADWRETPQ